MSNKSPVGAHHHITPVRTYVATLFALLVLMALTIAAAKVSFPGGTLTNNIVAMLIACIKATLVMLIFMGVAYTTKLAKLWSVLGFLWLTFAFGILIDYNTRDAIPGPYNDPGSALRANGARDLPATPGDSGVERIGKPKDE
jgi:caa(3)-type oxidase subunit IV